MLPTIAKQIRSFERYQYGTDLERAVTTAHFILKFGQKSIPQKEAKA